MCVTYVPTWGYGVTSHVIYNGWSYVQCVTSLPMYVSSQILCFRDVTGHVVYVSGVTNHVI